MVWDGRRKRSMIREFRSVNGCPPNLLTRQKKNQPEREFLENGGNPEIRKIRNNKQKCTKTEFPKDPAKCGNTKEEGQKKKSKTKPLKQKPGEEAHKKVAFRMGNGHARGDNQQVEQTKLLAVWNGSNTLSCNVVHACGRQQALHSAWRASKH